MKPINLNPKNKKLSKTDNRILVFLSNNIHIVASLNVLEVSKKTFSSTASVVRLCHKLGYKGFLDFKKNFKKDFHTNNDIKNPIIKKYINKLIEIDHISQGDVIANVVEKIKKAQQVIFIGEGESYLIARTASMLLQSKNYNATYSDVSSFDEALYKIDKLNTFIFFISFSGKTEGVVKIAKNLEKKHKSVCITSVETNELAKHTTYQLYSPLVYEHATYQAPASLLTRYVIIDIVAEKLKSI